MTEDSKRGSALICALKSDEVVELSKEYAELSIDALIESKTLESITFVSTVVGVYKVASSVRSQLFTEKIFRFLTHFSDLPDAERIKMTERLNENDKFAGQAGARLIEIIDRMESESKPEVAAEFLKSFAREEINFMFFGVCSLLLNVFPHLISVNWRLLLPSTLTNQWKWMRPF